MSGSPRCPSADLGVRRRLPGEPAGARAARHSTRRSTSTLVATRRGAITVRRVADGTEVAVLPAEGRPGLEMRFSPDGRWLAVNHGQWFWRHPNRFRVWDWRRGEVVLDRTVHAPSASRTSAPTIAGSRSAGRPPDGAASGSTSLGTADPPAIDLPEGRPPTRSPFTPTASVSPRPASTAAFVSTRCPVVGSSPTYSRLRRDAGRRLDGRRAASGGRV